MIILNYTETECWVADLRNQLYMVQPWETCEVNDVKWQYYVTSYWHIFRQVNAPVEWIDLNLWNTIMQPTPDEIYANEPNGGQFIPWEGQIDTEETTLDWSELTDLWTESNENAPVEWIELDLDTVTETLEQLTEQYETKFNKQVPPNMKNNIKWIKSQINS